MQAIAFAVWLFVIILISHMVDRVWSSLVKGSKAYRIFIAPGIAIHELSHAAACLVTGATITKLSLFDPKGGQVGHSEPKIPVVGQVLISLAPLIGCGAILWLSWKLLGIPIEIDSSALPASIELSVEGLANLAKDMIDLIAAGFIAIFEADFADIRTYVFLYAGVNLVVCMAPSKQDIRNALLGIAAISLVLFILITLDVEFIENILHRKGTIWQWLTLSVSLLLTIACITLLVAGAIKLVKFFVSPGSKN